MPTHVIVGIFFIGAWTIGFGQPSISPGAVVNDASLARQGLPNSGLAQGSIFSVSGRNLGPAMQVTGTFPLQTILAGTSLSVTVDTTTVSPLIVAAREDRITAILPSQTPRGTGTITAAYKGEISAAEPIAVVKNIIGIYGVTDINYGATGPTSSAKPGQELILWATGAGPVTFDETMTPPNQANLQSAAQARIYAGGEMVIPSFVGRATCCSGLDQINFQFPSSVPAGCSVPIAVQTSDGVSNFVTISVATGGGTCSDPIGLTGADEVAPQRLGFLTISSTTTNPGGTGRIQIVTTDTAEARFAESQTPFRMSPSTGCVVYTSPGLNPSIPFSGTPLDAGSSIHLSGPNSVSNELSKTKDGFYNANVAGDPFGKPGEYVFTGQGGMDIGPFTVSLKTAPAITWTNGKDIVNVREAAGQVITWDGNDLSGTVLITGTSGRGNEPLQASATFLCAAPASAKSFLIPSAVLSSLPPTFVGGVPVGNLAVTSQGSLQRFVISGLDAAYGMAAQKTILNVIYVKQ